MGQIERTDAAMPLVPLGKDVGQVSQVRPMQVSGQAGTGRQAQAATTCAGQRASRTAGTGASGGGKSAEGREEERGGGGEREGVGERKRERGWLLLLPKVFRRQKGLTWGKFKWHFQE